MCFFLKVRLMNRLRILSEHCQLFHENGFERPCLSVLEASTVYGQNSVCRWSCCWQDCRRGPRVHWHRKKWQNAILSKKGMTGPHTQPVIGALVVRLSRLVRACVPAKRQKRGNRSACVLRPCVWVSSVLLCMLFLQQQGTRECRWDSLSWCTLSWGCVCLWTLCIHLLCCVGLLVHKCCSSTTMQGSDSGWDHLSCI